MKRKLANILRLLAHRLDSGISVSTNHLTYEQLQLLRDNIERELWVRAKKELKKRAEEANAILLSK